VETCRASTAFGKSRPRELKRSVSTLRFFFWNIHTSAYYLKETLVYLYLMSGERRFSKFFITLFIFAITCFSSVFVFHPQVVHAEDEQQTQSSFGSGFFKLLLAPLLANPVLAPAVAPVVASGAVDTAESLQDAASSISSLPLKIAFAIGGVLLGMVAAILQFFAGIILHISVYLFDIAMLIATDGLSQIVNTGNTQTAIREAWTIFRDLINIGFVFVLLYIAINFILNAESSSTKKLLSNTIIAAFLINFSFFFAALVVDVSNQMAIEIRRSVDTELNGETLAGFLGKRTNLDSLVEAIQSGTGMATTGVEVNALVESKQASILDVAIKWGVGGILMLVLTLTLAIVLLIAAFTLIARTIILVLLLITSPIGFAGYVLPYTQKMAREWWQSLIGQAFFLPVFLLFILVAVKLINNNLLGIDFNGGQITSTSLDISDAQRSIVDLGKLIAGNFIQYAIVIGLFVGALTTAKKMSSMGSTVVSKLSGQITSTVGGAAFATAGFAGRNTVGRMADKALNSDRVQDFAAKHKYMGGLTMRGLNGVAGSTFDARGSRAFSGVASATGVGFGNAGGKGGIQGQDKWVAGQYQKTADLITIGKKKEAELKAAMPAKIQQAEAQRDRARNVMNNEEAAKKYDAQAKKLKESLKTGQYAKDEIQKRKNAYADDLEASAKGKLSKGLMLGTAKAAAADKIRKNINADPTTRAFEALQKAINDNTKNDTRIAKAAKENA